MTLGEPRIVQRWQELAKNLDDHGRDRVHDFEYGPPAGDMYLRNECSCHIHVRFDRPIGHDGPVEFCAEFHVARPNLPGPRQVSFDVGSDDERSVHARLVNGCGCRSHCDYQAVLVTVGEVAQERQWVRSLKWLKPLDDCLIVAMKVSDVGPATSGFARWKGAPPGERGGIILNRELDTALLVRGEDAVVVSHRQLEGEVIEGRAQVVGKVAYEDADTRDDGVHRTGQATDVHRVFAGLRLELDPDGWTIRFDLEDGADVGIQSLAVFACPADLGLDRAELQLKG